MTVEQFVKQAEAYYAEYAPIVRRIVSDYLRKYDEKQLDVLFELLVTTQSNNYGKAPDVAILERARNSNRKAMQSVSGIYVSPDGEVFNNQQHIGHMDGDRFIPAFYRLDENAKRKYLESYTEYDKPETYVKLLPEVKDVVKH